MSNSLLLLHTAITVLGIVGLIVGARLNPVIVLVLGSLYLGLATGLGFEGTAKAVTTGFGDLMAEVGLIIGFGVLCSVRCCRRPGRCSGSSSCS